MTPEERVKYIESRLGPVLEELALFFAGEPPERRDPHLHAACEHLASAFEKLLPPEQAKAFAEKWYEAVFARIAEIEANGRPSA